MLESNMHEVTASGSKWPLRGPLVGATAGDKIFGTLRVWLQLALIVSSISLKAPIKFHHQDTPASPDGKLFMDWYGYLSSEPPGILEKELSNHQSRDYKQPPLPPCLTASETPNNNHHHVV